jgi:cytochrome c oxidase cbb3-type subunit 4
MRRKIRGDAMSLDDASHVAQTWGLVVLTAVFLSAVIYALWPSNRDEFKQAARLPLEDDNHHE